MPTKTPKRSTLLRYWTLRYVITLCVGLLMLGVASVVWLQHAALTSRLQNIQNFSQEAADYVTSDTGQIVIPDHFYQWIDLNQRKYKLPAQFGLTVFNQTSNALFYKSAPATAGPPPEKGAQLRRPPPARATRLLLQEGLTSHQEALPDPIRHFRLRRRLKSGKS